MWVSDQWTDYALLDAAGGDRLERWGSLILVRPDPQIIWQGKRRHPLWDRADAVYHRSRSGGGSWEARNLPDEWDMAYRDMRFRCKAFSFKHTGIFPEQAANWDWMREIIRSAKNSGREGVRVLNLFAYTGGATLACALEGAAVTHVDASRGMVAWAKENLALSGLADAPVRYLVDDCVKFVQREIRRGNTYDAIILDPPSYGRGPKGETWKLEDMVDGLLRELSRLLSDDSLFVLLNSYTTGLSAGTLTCLVKEAFGGMGNAVSEELGLPVGETGMVLPCGASCRLTF